MKKVLLVKYGEIALRKGNRALFERRLMATLQGLIGDTGIHVTREQGRFRVEDTRGDINAEAVTEKIRRVFGITAILHCAMLPLGEVPETMAVLRNVAVDMLKNRTDIHSFKVETKRANKHFTNKVSRDISAEIGGFVLEHIPRLRVDVHRPDATLWIEIRNCAYVYTRAVACEAGLPYASTGKGVLLLSGGIDSPVAGFLMARRGLEIVPVYFHSPPYTSERALEKVTDLAACLAAYTGPLPVWVVPFTPVQMYIYENMPHAKLTLYLKRAMLRIGAAIAAREGAHCLVNGDSLGQVASQTAQSMAAIDAGCPLPVLRPLVGMDKQQIIDVARRIGTYDISIRPYEDCCTVFVPKHPENKPSAKAVVSIEQRHESALSALCEEAVANATQHPSG